MIANPPDATRATLTCAWCEQPLDHSLVRPFGTLRCATCGSTTAAGWPAVDPVRLARASRSEGSASRLC